jgi:uncharacterized membrane protein SpoIIM required for sporulation
MNRRRFLAVRQPDWQRFAATVKGLRRRTRDDATLAEFPSRFRALCQDLSLARHRRYGLGVTNQLNDLVQDGHNLLYGQRRSPLSGAARFLLIDFPREVRADAGLFWICTLLFFAPFLLLTLAGAVAPEWVLAVVGPEQRAQLASSFGGPKIVRDAESDVFMFGFYVWNNVGIDFRIFAGGIAFGLGTLFFLIFNGITLGAAFGYVIHADLGPSFFAFTAGHGSLELMAIPVAGMAGLKLAQGIIAPGRSSRSHALRARAGQAVRLLAGAATMTFMAAFVEAFWSASPVPHEVKYVVGALGWIVVLCFLGFGGRGAAR